ncbi:hypothetical protein V9T40_001253 [Parthenolecanium corni]|uniref:Uncharacterized protein n=1 Tax=Parthenolecanium corni TaxID=536013 RepID=A0AAN9TCL5_9HEMI
MPCIFVFPKVIILSDETAQTTQTDKNSKRKFEKVIVKLTVPDKEESILTPFMRHLSVTIVKPQTSTYIPSALNFYWIIHIMDDIIKKNNNFRKNEDAWHPNIIRFRKQHAQCASSSKRSRLLQTQYYADQSAAQPKRFTADYSVAPVSFSNHLDIFIDVRREDGSSQNSYEAEEKSQSEIR